MAASPPAARYSSGQPPRPPRSKRVSRPVSESGVVVRLRFRRVGLFPVARLRFPLRRGRTVFALVRTRLSARCRAVRCRPVIPAPVLVPLRRTLWLAGGRRVRRGFGGRWRRTVLLTRGRTTTARGRRLRLGRGRIGRRRRLRIGYEHAARRRLVRRR